MKPARQQQMTRLAAKEGDGCIGLDRTSHHRAAVAVDAARQIDREDEGADSVDGRDPGRAAIPSSGRSRPAPNSASTITAGEPNRGSRPSRPSPLQRPPRRGIALQPRRDRQPGSGGPDARARASSRAATNPSPPLLPGPAITRTAAVGGKPGADRIRHRTSGILHQLDAGNAARDRQPVGLRHLAVWSEAHACADGRCFAPDFRYGTDI